MSKQYKPQQPQLPTDLLSLEGNQLPIHGQRPKGTQLYPPSGVKHVTIDGEDYVHCPFEGKYVKGKPIVENDPNAPKITHKDGAAIYYCPSCKKVLATVGTPLYQTSAMSSVLPSSNKGRVSPRE